MPKRVLIVGNCAGDHAAIRHVLRKHFDVEVVRGFATEDTVDLLREEAFDLVLVNRTLYGQGSDGIELIRRLKADAQLAAGAVMLLSDHAEYQEQAVAAGALAGFGKATLHTPETRERLGGVLS